MHKLFQVEYSGENWYLRTPPSLFSMIMKMSPRRSAHGWPDIKHCELGGLYFFNTIFFNICFLCWTGLPVHHQLQESTQTHVLRVSDAIQPSHPLSSASPPALNLSQHQGLFK